MNTLGLRHLALNVKDPKASKKFYVDVLGMTVEWEPDAENIYLTHAGMDNLALHQAKGAHSKTGQTLDHFGFALPTAEDVDAWFAHLKKHRVQILKEIKTHRDGARSFYVTDPDGIVIQFIYHPPISASAARKT